MGTIKARDIIPGWPRGRSVMTPYPVFSFWLPMEPLRSLMLTDNDIIERRNELQSEIDRIDDYFATKHYHQMQQIMVDEYRRKDYKISYMSNGVVPITLYQRKPDPITLCQCNNHDAKVCQDHPEVQPSYCKEKLIYLEPDEEVTTVDRHGQVRTSRTRNKAAKDVKVSVRKQGRKHPTPDKKSRNSKKRKT